MTNDELRALAEAALESWSDCQGDWYVVADFRMDGSRPIEPPDAIDAAFICAATPERVIALLDENKRLRAALTEVGEHFNTQHVPEAVRMLGGWQRYRDQQQDRIAAALGDAQ